MTVAITLRGALEPILADEDFLGTIQAMNLSSAKGNNFIVLDMPDGTHTAVKMDNILTISEHDDDLQI